MMVSVILLYILKLWGIIYLVRTQILPEKQTFLTPWYAHVRVQSVSGDYVFGKSIFNSSSNVWGVTTLIVKEML